MLVANNFEVGFMTVIGDSYMDMILPEDISDRIKHFMSGRQNFPYIKEDEIMCLFYIYGKEHKVKNQHESIEATDLAERTVSSVNRDVEYYSNSADVKIDPEFTKSKYIRRELQISIERQNSQRQLWNDPTVLSDCFVQHISYYKQHYFFQIYGPLKESELIKDIREKLCNRIVMIGYNRKDQSFLPFQHPLTPLYIWFREKFPTIG